MRLPKFFVYTAVWGFAALFIGAPLLILVLTGFTGEPIPLLEYLCSGGFRELWQEITRNFSGLYYCELWETRRYRLGVINSLGLAPLCVSLFFMAVCAVEFLTAKIKPAWGRALKKWRSLPVLLAVTAAVTAAALSWRAIVPAELQSRCFMRWLAPGRCWEDRLLQGIGFTPAVVCLSVLLAVALAWCFKYTNMPGKKAFRFLSVLPLALPSFLGALAMKNLWGINGVLTKLWASLGLEPLISAQSVTAALIVQVFLYFPLVLLPVSAVWERSSENLRNTAESFGSSGLFTLLSVDLPMIWPGILAGAVLVYIRSLGDFSALSLLMPIKYPLLILEAYRDLSGSTYWGGACMISSLILVVVAAVLLMQKLALNSDAYSIITGRSLKLSPDKAGVCRRRDWSAFLFALTALSVPVLFLALTFLVSIAGSWGIELLPSSYTFERYLRIADGFLKSDSPLLNSLILSLAGVSGAVFLALVTVFTSAKGKQWYYQLLDYAVLLPFVIPGTALAIALICAFNGPPLALHLTASLVVCAYILTSAPYAVRTLAASLKQVGRELAEGSLVLGADGLYTKIKIILPLIKGGLGAGIIIVFIACIQEVAVTVMICPPEWRPAAVYIFTEIQEGNVFNASAYGILVFLLILIPYAFILKLRLLSADIE